MASVISAKWGSRPVSSLLKTCNFQFSGHNRLKAINNELMYMQQSPHS